ncbi:hypothetical protein P168DRAFT_303651 [Aspergillus campestris IBT 28561]|uniref:Large ribosomal subunit protein mL54 n=1 Tax=Aspergillus campestris (strain IBT 28561) TaxID=1392248 RepID=A0A2I1D7X9_ASPC2|nr:uncharacterized protein P168DRAFT_303651 [Aspergillus campestris IBT 28561]PKY05957.1 hypothetical protein P168DRAFT_303651 [Aspergillus campestris IBT 28561]
MICQRCRTGILSRLQQPQTAVSWSGARQFPLQRYQHQARSYSDGKPTVSATPPPPAPRQPVTDDVSIPSAVSSATPGVSQPLSTPGEVHISPSQKKTPKQERPPSWCIAGSRMTGLNYFKNKPDVLALEDSEYPEWLWSLLDGGKSEKKGGVDPNTLNKAQRKRYDKKMAARAATLPPKIPVHHHATDLTPAQEEASKDLLSRATESLEKREDITKSARDARRKAIREANFLRGL